MTAKTTPIGQVEASKKAQRKRLRTIVTASLLVAGLSAFFDLFQIHPPIRLGISLIVLAVCLIGIAAILRLWWIEFKR